MAVRRHKNGWEVRAYDPASKTVRYVGRAKTREEADELFRHATRHFGVRRSGLKFRDLVALEPKIAEAADDDETGGYVYFIQGEAGGPIKIGTSIDPIDRLADLQAGSPVPLVIRRVIPGSRAKEHELHVRFREHRLWGEWFDPCPELLELAEASADELEQRIARLILVERQREALLERVAELEAALHATREALDTAWIASNVSPPLRLPEAQPRAGEDDEQERSAAG